MPNGLCFSPDEKRLYVNDRERALIRVYDVAADGRCGADKSSPKGWRPSKKRAGPTA